MNILETYIEKNSNEEWFNDHFSLGDGAHGRLFEYTNTNFRKQHSFISQFEKFREVENLPREEWPLNPNNGQELHKHVVVPSVQSKLFKKEISGLYTKTTKGVLYENFIKTNLPKNEKWLINYTFLLNSYFLNRKNYIIHRVRDDLITFLMAIEGISAEFLIRSSKALLALEDEDIYSILRQDFFYIHSFYNDTEFLTAYLRSSPKEKEELALYIEQNLLNGDFKCCISRKYKPGSNFTKAMLLDETRVFLLTFLFIQTRSTNLENIYTKIATIFDENILPITKKKVIDYFRHNQEVFEIILEDVLELEDPQAVIFEDDITETIQAAQIDIRDTPEIYIDETSEVGRQRIKTIFSLKKKQARILSNHTCALEQINNCRPTYFTAKKGGKTYLELHHFIPQEFRNDFPYSIEVLANYVTLCPRCHRQIHLATDQERRHLINALYNERINRLKLVGLHLELKDVYSYYKID